MYAVIRTGGKQYRVAKDDVITVERLPGDAGADVTFDEVLLKGEKVGSPAVQGMVVKGKILEQARDDKIIVFKKKRRKDYRRTLGHRQDLTVVQITNVGGKAKKSTAKKKAAKAPAKAADDATAEVNK